jgi:hypothetical protein
MNATRSLPPPNTTRFDDQLRRLSARATGVFLTLIDGLAAGAARRLDNAKGAFMAVSIDCLFIDRALPDDRGRTATYAIAHRYEVNGDLVPDPDVEFILLTDADQRIAARVYPTAIDHGPLGYRRYVELDSAGQPLRVEPRGQSNLASFCDQWMNNIAAQQGLVRS